MISAQVTEGRETEKNGAQIRGKRKRRKREQNKVDETAREAV